MHIVPPPPASLIDGLHRLKGTVLVAGNPDTPVTRPVRLLRSFGAPTVLGLTISSADGTYTFEGLRKPPADDGYTVIAYDPTGQYDPVAKTNLVPSPMPPDPSEHP